MQGKIEIKAVFFRQFRLVRVKLFFREVLLKSVVSKGVLGYYIAWF
jgi:hypothetical protein